ncbi:MAG TPA: hypothetical protein EYN67_00850 [Flavobacteriales bacterium]|nr:hypothetical protein [Flavobacteriales bacterium]
MNKPIPLQTTIVHSLRKYSFEGGYPLFYTGEHNNVHCADCAEECSFDDANYVAHRTEAVNWESEIHCDLCSEKIESAYGYDEDSVEDES